MMSERQLQSLKNKVTLTTGTRQYGVYAIPINVEHVGKQRHSLHLSFKVHQSENSQNDINVYVMNQDTYFVWQNTILPREILEKIDKIPKMAQHVIKRSQGEDITLEIHESGMLCVIFDNRFSTLTRKNIVLEYWQTWDETIPNEEILVTVPAVDESLKEEIERMIDESQEKLLIISPYCDMTLISQLLTAKNSGVNIKIILRNDKEIKGLAKDGLEQIKKNFPNDHKLIKNIHSRLIICDSKEAIVSSADLDQKSLQGLLNIGIKTSNPKLVKDIILFFEQVWKSS